MTFKDAMARRKTLTENDMVTNISSGNACTDLFFKAGAMRDMDIVPYFAKAMDENKDYAIRMMYWIRDCRQGLGEKQQFRNMLRYLVQSRAYSAIILPMITDMGYWKDVLWMLSDEACLTRDHQSVVLKFIVNALDNGDRLCAKWMPRQGEIAGKIRSHMGITPKVYRKRLVELTAVVETPMSAGKWDDIKFETVPSVAHNIYKKAFDRHTPKYAEYLAQVIAGEKTINASVLYPYQVLQTVIEPYRRTPGDDSKTIIAQWSALPDYMNNARVLPMIDTSGSMTIKTGNTTCMTVAVSLGLYVADKAKGPFKDVVMTFNTTPALIQVSGDIINKTEQTMRLDWGGSTNLEEAFTQLLNFGRKYRVPNDEMPETIIILSDMEFNQCVQNPQATANKMIKKQYKDAGYKLPNIIFWNIQSRHDNVPVRFDKTGTALVSGFSQNILKNIFDIENLTPEKIMLETIMQDRYDWQKQINDGFNFPFI